MVERPYGDSGFGYGVGSVRFGFADEVAVQCLPEPAEKELLG